MVALILLGYLGAGLLLMGYMCPYWHPFEKLVGALIWPISAGIGIRELLRDRAIGSSDDDLIQLQVAMVAAAVQETHRIIKR